MTGSELCQKRWFKKTVSLLVLLASCSEVFLFSHLVMSDSLQSLEL